MLARAGQTSANDCFVPTLAAPGATFGDNEALLRALATLHDAGVDIDWTEVRRGDPLPISLSRRSHKR